VTDGLSTVNVANAWLNTLRNVSTQFAAVYVELHTNSPGASGSTATSAGSSTRLQATFAAAASGQLALTAAIGPWTNGGTTETLTDLALWTAATGGTFLMSLPLTVAKPWSTSDTFTLNTLTLTLAPLAA
jgi:hypothetical protein